MNQALKGLGTMNWDVWPNHACQSLDVRLLNVSNMMKLGLERLLQEKLRKGQSP